MRTIIYFSYFLRSATTSVSKATTAATTSDTGSKAPGDNAQQQQQTPLFGQTAPSTTTPVSGGFGQGATPLFGGQNNTSTGTTATSGTSSTIAGGFGGQGGPLFGQVNSSTTTSGDCNYRIRSCYRPMGV